MMKSRRLWRRRLPSTFIWAALCAGATLLSLSLSALPCGADARTQTHTLGVSGGFDAPHLNTHICMRTDGKAIKKSQRCTGEATSHTMATQREQEEKKSKHPTKKKVRVSQHPHPSLLVKRFNTHTFFPQLDEHVSAPLLVAVKGLNTHTFHSRDVSVATPTFCPLPLAARRCIYCRTS